MSSVSHISEYGNNKVFYKVTEQGFWIATTRWLIDSRVI